MQTKMDGFRGERAVYMMLMWLGVFVAKWSDVLITKSESGFVFGVAFLITVFAVFVSEK